MIINEQRAAEIEACMEVLVKQALTMEAARDAGDEAEAHRVGLEAANSLLAWTPIEHGAMTIALALGVGQLKAETDHLEDEVASLKEIIASYAAKQHIPARGVMIGDHGIQTNTFNESKDSHDA